MSRFDHQVKAEDVVSTDAFVVFASPKPTVKMRFPDDILTVECSKKMPNRFRRFWWKLLLDVTFERVKDESETKG